MKVQFYLGRYMEEKLLFEEKLDVIPSRGDLICYDKEIYKVRYVMFDIQFNGIYVFLRVANEEDF